MVEEVILRLGDENIEEIFLVTVGQFRLSLDKVVFHWNKIKVREYIALRLLLVRQFQLECIKLIMSPPTVN